MINIALYDTVDLDWTWDGDFLRGNDGDLQDTSDDFIRSLENEIQSIVKSSTGDWFLHPARAADLSDYVGEPNTRKTGEVIQDRVKAALINSGVVQPHDLSVRVVPVGYHEVMIRISVNAISTPNNRLVVGTPVIATLLYDTMENGIFFLPTNENERAANGGAI